MIADPCRSLQMLADGGRAFWACFLDEAGDSGVIGGRLRTKTSEEMAGRLGGRDVGTIRTIRTI
jgi:hypothetical protein